MRPKAAARFPETRVNAEVTPQLFLFRDSYESGQVGGLAKAEALECNSELNKIMIGEYRNSHELLLCQLVLSAMSETSDTVIVYCYCSSI